MRKPKVGDVVEVESMVDDSDWAKAEVEEIVDSRFRVEFLNNSFYRYYYFDNQSNVCKWRWPDPQVADFQESNIVTNDQGGRQSDVPYAFDAIPIDALMAIARVFKTGREKHGSDNHLRLTLADHVNHGVGHSFLGLNGDTSEDHFAHAACRALMALQLAIMARKGINQGTH